MAGLLVSVAGGVEVPEVEDRAMVEEGSVVIVSWNLRNYLAMDRRTEDGFRPDYPKPEAEKEALRGVLMALQPDILFVQEIGGPGELLELQRDLARAGLELPYGSVADNADPVRRVGFLSGIEPVAVGAVGDLDFAYFGGREVVKRGVQEVCFRIGGRELWIYNLHLKSRYTDRGDDPESEMRRTREAEAVRNYILDRHDDPEGRRGDGWLVVGDFNDHPRSSAVRRFLTKGSREIGVLIEAEDSRGERWTHRYDAHDAYTRVDMLVAGGGFHEVWEWRAWLEDAPEVLVASDHRPVVLEVGESVSR